MLQSNDTISSAGERGMTFPSGLLDHVLDGFYVVNPDCRIVQWNEAAERITGYLRQDVLGRQCGDQILSHCDQDGVPLCERGCPMRNVLEGGRPTVATVYLRHKEGYRIPVLARHAAVADEQGKLTGAAQIFHETRNIGLALKLRGLESFGCLDPVTGTGTREFTEMKCGQRLEEMHRFGIPLALILGTVRNLGDVRARLGQGAQDAMARAVAQTIAYSLPPNAFLGRWTEHQMVAAIPRCDPMKLHQLTTRLIAIGAVTNIDWWGERLPCELCLRSVWAEPGDSIGDLLRRLEGSASEC